MDTGKLKYSYAAIVLFLFISFLVNESNQFFSRSSQCTKKPSVAIIGAGIGGTACAYFLTELFDSDIYMDIYEAEEFVGGRLKTVYVGANEIELGGTVIHPKNRYMSNFADKFGLEIEHPVNGRMGIYNGKEFSFIESDWGIVNLIKMIYRYGIINTICFYRDVKFMLTKFERIYLHQDRKHTFNTVDEMLGFMDKSFPGMRNISIEDSLRKKFGDLMYEDIILSIMNVNYGQGGFLHEFVGSVSLAGAMPGLWSVKGGNRLVAESLYKHSSALIMHAPVSKIEFNEVDKKYSLAFPWPMNRVPFTTSYDVVVVAAPLSQGNHNPLTFGKGINKEGLSPRKYHHTWCTIVEGELNYETFNCTPSTCPTEIFTPNQQCIFNSISRLSKQDDLQIWKVFSRERLVNLELKKIFLDGFILRAEEPWLAYPEYSPHSRNDSFIIQPNLFYLNAIEWAASAMEMSVVSAKNIALLIYNNWKKSDHYRKISCDVKNFWEK